MAKGPPRILEYERKLARQSNDVQLEIKSGPFSRTEQSNRVKREILLLLDRCGPAPIDEIIVEIDAHPVEVEQLCNELLRSGLICTCSCGVYDITRAELSTGTQP